MPETFKQYICEFCLTKSDIEPEGWHEAHGWTRAMDAEGPLDRCPKCSSGIDYTGWNFERINAEADVLRELKEPYSPGAIEAFKRVLGR